MPIDPNAEARIKHSTLIRNELATQDTAPPKPSQNPNGDEARADKIGTYSKALIQDSPGFVNLTAFKAFREAINKAGFAPGLHNMPNGILGGTAQLNGPQGAFAFQLNCLDSAQFGPTTVPAARSFPVRNMGRSLSNFIGPPFCGMCPSPNMRPMRRPSMRQRSWIAQSSKVPMLAP